MIKIGIGFVTGRKSFKNVVRTYANSWYEHNLVQDQNISLNLFVVYDLHYHSTRISDYKKMDDAVYEMIDTVTFIGKSKIRAEADQLVDGKVLSRKEARLIFGDGYAKRRNTITYLALQKQLDYLIFLDDDEYPLAAVQSADGRLTWQGQDVLPTHLKYISGADITHGHHCGYISPIPYLRFNEALTEADFRLFIEAISNDIISWESIKEKMTRGGITLAEKGILESPSVTEVREENGAKFISGSNLCLNLHSIRRMPPFYNPPRARGEDTFLSTCLSGLTVLKVPCYTFHDGFSTYNHLLHGVLPRKLKPITADSPRIVARFLRAGLGWVRYKPLFVYITQRDDYDRITTGMRRELSVVIPKLDRYFNHQGFKRIQDELDYYLRNVQRHFEDFEETKRTWRKLIDYVVQSPKVGLII